MNNDLPWDPAALDEFIQCLEEFRKACGRPSLRELSRLSRTVVSEYRDPRYRNLPELSPATLSAVLSHGRQGPPKFTWVASFVLTCQRYAAESRLAPHDPGGSTLPEWNRRLQAVYRTQGRPTGADGDGPIPLSAPVPDDPGPQDGGDGPVPRLPAVRPHAATWHTAEPPPPGGDLREAGSRSLSELRLRDLYGPYGVRLFRAAEERRDPEACYRLGLLLYTDDRPSESQAWLRRAETAGHRAAGELIHTMTPRRVALAHAYRLGVEATGRGDAEAADTFLTRVIGRSHVGGHDHPVAAFELGALWLERRALAHAFAWFSSAAERGHPLGRWWADQIHRDAGAEGLRLPPAPAGRSDSRPVSVPTLTQLIEQVVSEPNP